MNNQNTNTKQFLTSSIKMEEYQNTKKSLLVESEISSCFSEDDLDSNVFRNLMPPQLSNKKKKSIVKLKRIVSSLSNRGTTFQRFNKSELTSLKSYMEHSSAFEQEHHQSEENEASLDKVGVKSEKEKHEIEEESESFQKSKDLLKNCSTLRKRTKKEKNKKSHQKTKPPIIMTNQVFDIIKDYFS